MNNMPQRLVFFALGVVINSFGVALITLGNLGTSAISSVPYVCSLQFPMFSFGVTTFIWNILLILLQVVLLRRDFKPSQFLQIMVNVLFSAMIDVSMAILGVLYPTMLWEQFLCIGLGCVALAFGIVIELAPNVVVVPGEGVVRAIAKVSGRARGHGEGRIRHHADHHRRGAVIDLLPRVARRRHRHGDFRGVGWANHQHRQSRLHLPALHRRWPLSRDGR